MKEEHGLLSLFYGDPGDPFCRTQRWSVFCMLIYIELIVCCFFAGNNARTGQVLTVCLASAAIAYPFDNWLVAMFEGLCPERTNSFTLLAVKYDGTMYVPED